MHSERDFQAYLRGDLHVDGWVSQWKKDLLRRRAEETDKAAKTKWSKGKAA